MKRGILLFSISFLVALLNIVFASAVCVNPSDGQSFTSDTELCSGTFNLPNGVSVQSSDISIFCDATVLNGTNTGNGISISKFNNITIKDCNIKHYSFGVSLIGSNNSKIINNNISNSMIAVFVSGSSSIFIPGSSSSDEIKDNIIFNNNQGVSVSLSSHNNNIDGNIVYNTTSSAINVFGSNNNSISNNVVYASGTGLGLQGGSIGSGTGVSPNNNRVFYNNVSGNDLGILIMGGGNVVSNNVVSNGSVGIEVVSFNTPFFISASAYNNITNNIVANNSMGIIFTNGVFFTPVVTVSNVLNNTIVNNTRGMSIRNSFSNIISGNKFNNSVYDISTDKQFPLTPASTNTLIIKEGSNQVKFEDKFINITDMDNLFVGRKIAAVNSSAEPIMSTSANVTFVVSSCSATLFENTGFFKKVRAATPGAVSCTDCTDLVCSGNILHFNKGSWSTVFVLNNLPVVSNVNLKSQLGKNTTKEELTVTFTTSDADNDVVTNITDWRINGGSIASMNMPFDGQPDSSTIAADYSTFKNNGTVNGAVWTPNGRRGGAYQFDGISSNIDVPNVFLGGTITMWIKNATDTDWHFIVIDSSSGNYVDGVFGAVKQQPVFFDNGHAIIGQDLFTGEPFRGLIDDVVLYNSVLNYNQILRLNASRYDKIVPKGLVGGQNWTSCVTPNDGNEDGATVCSNQVQIRGPPKQPLRDRVFVISDENWRDVLPLVPVTTWTKGGSNIKNLKCVNGSQLPDNICVYPTLIYHNESTGFDAYAVNRFINKYNPLNLTLVNVPDAVALYLSGPLNSRADIQRITTQDYFSYWDSFTDVVYVEDNYTQALMAADYASLINAPLVINGTTSDQAGVFFDSNLSTARNIICVGSVSPPFGCNKRYTLRALQSKYINVTSTKKVILVNPEDIKRYNFTGPLEYASGDEVVGTITRLHSKISLTAPFLAGAKQEVIVSVLNNDVPNYNTFGLVAEKIDAKFESQLNRLYNIPSLLAGNDFIQNFYLTVVANGDAITSGQIPLNNPPPDIRFERRAYDQVCYGNLHDPCGVEPGFVLPNPVTEFTPTPGIEEIETFTSKRINFSLTPVDPEGEDLTLNWTVNNVLNSSKTTPSLSKANFSKTFKSAGVFVVTATAIDNTGLRATYSWIVNVANITRITLPPNTAHINVGSDVPTPTPWPPVRDIYRNETFTFDINADSGTGLSDFLTVNWSIDGQLQKKATMPSGLHANFTATFPTSGIHVVKVVVNNSLGVKDSYGWVINVFGTRIIGKPDISVGRIDGMTLSDASSLVARSLFYDQLKDTNDSTFLVVWAHPDMADFDSHRNAVHTWYNKFAEVRSNVSFAASTDGLQNFVSPLWPVDDRELWINKDLILYNGHGSDNFAGIDGHDLSFGTSLPELDNSVEFSYSCLACANEDSASFCGWATRRGAVAQVTTVSVVVIADTVYKDSLNNIYYDNMSIGEGFNRAFGDSLVYDKVRYLGQYVYTGTQVSKPMALRPFDHMMVTLIGDPTLHYKPLLQNKIIQTINQTT